LTPPHAAGRSDYSPIPAVIDHLMLGGPGPRDGCRQPLTARRPLKEPVVHEPIVARRSPVNMFVVASGLLGGRPPARGTCRRREKISTKCGAELFQIFWSPRRASGRFFRGVIFSWDFFSVPRP
jgi:hypothetical protein